MPIWRSSELLVGRPGSPNRRNSGRVAASQTSSARTSTLPPLPSDGTVETQDASSVVQLPQARKSLQARRGSSSRTSASNLSSWEVSQAMNPGFFGVHLAAAGAGSGVSGDQQDAAKQAQTPTPRSRAVSGAASAVPQTYTVQYIGIANGELGILSQKQKLTPSRSSVAIVSPTSTAPIAPRFRSQSAVVHSHGSLAGCTPQAVTRPTTAAPAPAPTTAAPAPAAAAAAATAAGASAATTGETTSVSQAPAAVSDSVPPQAQTPAPESVSGPGSPASLPQSLSRLQDLPPQEEQAAAPGAVELSRDDDAAALTDTALREEHPATAAATVLSLGDERVPEVEAAGSSEGSASLAEGLSSSPNTGTTAATAVPKPPCLSSIVDDARGQVKVISECFYSRALHSRAVPHDRHARQNRPIGPQVRDMELLSTGMPGRFGRRAPSAGGFSGWKLTTPASTAANGLEGMRSGSGVGLRRAVGSGSEGSMRSRASSAGPA